MDIGLLFVGELDGEGTKTWTTGILESLSSWSLGPIGFFQELTCELHGSQSRAETVQRSKRRIYFTGSRPGMQAVVQNLGSRSEIGRQTEGFAFFRALHQKGCKPGTDRVLPESSAFAYKSGLFGRVNRSRQSSEIFYCWIRVDPVYARNSDSPTRKRPDPDCGIDALVGVGCICFVHAERMPVRPGGANRNSQLDQ